MRYDAIRKHVQVHFSDLLRGFKSDVSENGPLDDFRLDSLSASKALATEDPDGFLALAYPDGIEGLLGKFCALAGIKEDLTPTDKKHLVQEIMLAFGTYSEAALHHNAEFDSIDLSGPDAPMQSPAPTVPEATETYAEVVQQYLAEGRLAGSWAAKTLGEKEDALALLSEITGGKAVRLLVKADARQVKDVLMRLPRNRRKTAATRDLTLLEMLEISGVQVITARTLNAYISNLQSFFKWAVDNGHADTNIFAGTRVRITAKPKDDDRKAFTDAQLQLMFLHLTENPSGLVTKDDHKWPALIAMFSGMRLNEVAQLQPDDVRLVGEVWCFDVNTTGDSNKSLKNQSSHRLVPVHQRLLDTGILAFIALRRSQRACRLFPSLTYSKQNGYGR